MAAKTMTPKELAVELHTDAKTLRKFLRDNAETLALDTPGQGGRYSLTGKQAQSIRKAFSNRTVRVAKAKDEAVADEAIETDEELEELEDVEV